MELEPGRKLAPVPHTWASGCSRRTSHPDPHIRRPTSAEKVKKMFISVFYNLRFFAQYI